MASGSPTFDGVPCAQYLAPICGKVEHDRKLGSHGIEVKPANHFVIADVAFIWKRIRAGVLRERPAILGEDAWAHRVQAPVALLA